MSLNVTEKPLRSKLRGTEEAVAVLSVNSPPNRHDGTRRNQILETRGVEHATDLV